MAICNHNKRQLFSLERLLQQQALAARAELIGIHRSMDKIFSGRRVLRDKDSLSSAQTIGFYDHGPIYPGERSHSFPRGIKHAKHLRGRNTLSTQEFLREHLAGL